MRTELPWIELAPLLKVNNNNKKESISLCYHRSTKQQDSIYKSDLHQTLTFWSLDFPASKTVKMKFLLLVRCPVCVVLPQLLNRVRYKPLVKICLVLHILALFSCDQLLNRSISAGQRLLALHHLCTISACRVCSHEAMNKQAYYQIKCRGVGDEVLFQISHRSLCGNTRVRRSNSQQQTGFPSQPQLE